MKIISQYMVEGDEKEQVESIEHQFRLLMRALAALPSQSCEKRLLRLPRRT